MKRTRLLVCALLAAAPAVLVAQAGYVPQRVFDNTRGAFSDFETMAADLAHADVVFLGEQHDDANTHKLELMTLQAILRRRPTLTLSLEMFERDVQEPLDHFAMGHMPEAEFLTVSRPWPSYATDYKPLVDLAIAHDWPVVAANVPRSLASEVSKAGLDVLRTKSAAEKRLFAAELKCPTDDTYFHRFAEAMGDHPASADTAAGAVSAAQQSLERFYFAQCLKDETMAESIAQAWQGAASGPSRPLVVHVNGAFHSDFTQGTAERTIRRLPGKRIVVISVLPVESLDNLTPSEMDRKRADYLIYTAR